MKNRFLFMLINYVCLSSCSVPYKFACYNNNSKIYYNTMKEETFAYFVQKKIDKSMPHKVYAKEFDILSETEDSLYCGKNISSETYKIEVDTLFVFDKKEIETKFPNYRNVDKRFIFFKLMKYPNCLIDLGLKEKEYKKFSLSHFYSIVDNLIIIDMILYNQKKMKIFETIVYMDKNTYELKKIENKNW